MSDLYENNQQQAIMTAAFAGFDITVGNTCLYPGLGPVLRMSIVIIYSRYF